MRNGKAFWLILFVVFCGCSKYSVVCNDRDPVEQAGINHFQTFVDQVEKFKADNGKYPKTLQELGSSVFDDGAKIPDARIKQSSYNFSPDGKSFSTEFFFDREKSCLVGNNRACKYTSETKNWSCY